VGTYGLVLEANQRGDSLTSRKFPARKPASVSVLVTGIRQLRDGGFLVVSRLDSANISLCGFTRFNANLQEQWTYIYRPANSFKFSPPEASQGTELADGSLLGAINLYKINTNSVRLLHVTATGQLLQEYTVPSTTFGVTSLTSAVADSSFVLSGGENSGLATIMQLRIPGLRRVLAEPPLPPAQVFLATQGPVALGKLSAYPNPASTVLHVPYTLPQGVASAELLAYDALGRLVLRQSVAGSQGETAVEVQRWSTGLYQFSLIAGGHVIGQQRIAVTH
jgi:hypothetical protein